MSRRRRPGRNPWRPWTGPTTTDGPTRDRIRTSTQDSGRTRIDAYGVDAGAIAVIDAFRKAGASRVAFGWDAPGHEPSEDVPVGVPVTWWFRVEYPDGRVRNGRYGPTTEHGRGILEAAAQILRAGGATVTIVDAGAN